PCLLGGCFFDERSLRDGNGAPAALLSDAGLDPRSSCSATQDCNVVSNASFDQSVTGWDSEPNVAASWTSADAADDPSSGCLELQNAWQGDVPSAAIAGVAQCVRVIAGGSYALDLDVYVNDSGSAAGFELSFFDAGDCTSASATPAISDFSGA